MSNKLNRVEFLYALEVVQPGLYKRDTVEQGTCFIFMDGDVCTFNEEVFCRAKTGLDKSFKAAIPAQKLLEMVRKFPDNEIEVETKEDSLLIRGENRLSKHVLEKDIVLPIDVVEKPSKWVKLPNDFCEAINVVKDCASDKSQHLLEISFVHIHPKWLEACDGIQLCRWEMKTGISSSTLIKRSSVSHVAGSGVCEFSETDNWLHFRRASGSIISCRKWTEEYRDLNKYLDVRGDVVELPKSIANDTAMAEVFSSEDKHDDKILVVLGQGKLKLKSVGINGMFTAVTKLSYNGEGRSFRISPRLLEEVVKRHSKVEISGDRLKAKVDGKFVYVVALSRADKSVESNGKKTEPDKKVKSKKVKEKV